MAAIRQTSQPNADLTNCRIYFIVTILSLYVKSGRASGRMSLPHPPPHPLVLTQERGNEGVRGRQTISLYHYVTN